MSANIWIWQKCRFVEYSVATSLYFPKEKLCFPKAVVSIASTAAKLCGQPTLYNINYIWMCMAFDLFVIAWAKSIFAHDTRRLGCSILVNCFFFSKINNGPWQSIYHVNYINPYWYFHLSWWSQKSSFAFCSFVCLFCCCCCVFHLLLNLWCLVPFKQIIFVKLHGKTVALAHNSHGKSSNIIHFAEATRMNKKSFTQKWHK